MYDTRLTDTSLSLDSILERTTEYDIYSHYISDNQFSIGKIISSPFREDKNPSFGVFKSSKTSSLLYKDLSTGSTGNCVHFIQQLFNLTYRQALIRILKDIVNFNLKSSVKGTSIKEDYRTTSTVISIKRKNFCEADDLYWNQYCLFRDDLRHFNVIPIQMYWINEIVQSWAYKWVNPGYAYQVYNKYKIYKPLSEFKKDKWLSNCTNYDVQGMEQLVDNGDLLIITKSLKDVMVLHKLGYNAIAPNSENNGVPKCIIDNLKKRFTRIVVLYDNDEAGINGSKKLCDKYQLESIMIPIGLPKDISDYIKEYKMDDTKKLIKDMLCEEANINKD